MSQRYIYQQQWTESERISEADFSKLYMSKPHQIGPALTFLMGEDNVYMTPLTYHIDGLGNVQQEIDGYEYQYKVVTSFNRTIPLAKTVNITRPGLGLTTFPIYFKERYFARDYSIFTENKYELGIVADPVREGSLWKYTVQLRGTADFDAYVDPDELVEGKFFAKGYALVGIGGSQGNDSQVTSWAEVRGNISLMRKSVNWDGDVMHREMTVDLGKFGMGKMFWGFQQWQIEKQWQEEVEHYYWYSKSNRATDGKYHQLDSAGNPIIQGDGLLAQIGNRDTYGELDIDKLSQVIRDMYSGMKDAENKEITLMTGFGGAEAFDKAIRTSVLGSGFNVNNSNQFIKGDGRNLRSTGFFTSYDHIDGYTVKVKVVDLFNYGTIAVNTPIHPISGLHMESHRMVFLDTSSYGGKSNIEGIYSKGNKFHRNVVAGVGQLPPGFPEIDYRASDKHSHSIHYMKGCGVVMYRFNTSIDLECILS